tara:strand:+ start:2911 stop:3597 length:687 start_codon:yes stop_codon:yes gene_type:complete
MPELAEDLINEISEEVLDLSCEYKGLETDEDGRFEGYASVFGNKDLGNDVIEKGAFLKSIHRKKPKDIKLLYQHKTDEPIGVIESIEEDNKGLKVKGKLVLGTQRGRETYELMKAGAINSMSIGYRLNPKGYHYDDKNKKRVIKEVDLMEISMVTFPMNPKAKVDKVKMADGTITTREIESVLWDSGIFSYDLCKSIASYLHDKYGGLRDVAEDDIEGIKQLINILKK